MEQVIENTEGILTNTIISGSNVTEGLIVDLQTVASQAQPSSLSSSVSPQHEPRATHVTVREIQE